MIRRPEARPRNNRDAGVDQQVLRELVVILEAQCAYGALDLGEGVKSTRAGLTGNPWNGIQLTDDKVLPIFECLVHIRNA